MTFTLQHQRDGFGVIMDNSLPDQGVEVIQDVALSCVLNEGETLFVPKGWWHRVENVWTGEEENGCGWTAGVGWWFRMNAST